MRKHRAKIQTMMLGAIALAAALAAPSAMARPRDDVMSGAFRCAAIGDSKVWLDCYYGAAQPARAALGMLSAPPAQVKLVSAPPVGGSVLDHDVRDAVMAGAFRCTSAADERQWLNCYYAAAQPMRARLGLSAAPQAGAAHVAPPVPPGPALALAPQFGRKPPPRQEIPDNVDHVTAQMRSYTFDKLGWFTVTLDNGQVWKQVQGDTTFARNWKKPAASYQVRVSHGFLGSYNLQVRGQPGLYKVIRAS
jgi:hypothetical protein